MKVPHCLARSPWLPAAALLAISGCNPPAASKTSPAEVKAPNEQNLSTVTLSDTAYRQLDLAAGLTKVEIADRPRTRTLGGDAMVPPGRGARVGAPLAGSVRAPAAGMPKPGQKIEQGQAIFEFTPLLTAEAKVNLVTVTLEAQEQVKAARIQLELAEAALKRTRQLASDKTVSQRVLEEAVAARDLAKQTVDTSVVRQALLDKVLADATGGQDAEGKETTISLRAPVAGVLQRLTVAPGASVAAGVELFEVVQIDPLWIRVPVYAGTIDELKTDEPADVRRLGARPEGAIAAAPLPDPPLVADAAAASVDVYYRIANPAGKIRPGQKVSVTLRIRGDQEPRLIVPWSAVVQDIYGGTWVYEQLAGQERSFRRRRVEVLHLEGTKAVLASGPPVGTAVATGGAVELLGTEFGFGAQAKK